MVRKADNYPEDPVPPFEFDASMKLHVGIRPPQYPGDVPTGYVLREVPGGKPVPTPTESERRRKQKGRP